MLTQSVSGVFLCIFCVRVVHRGHCCQRLVSSRTLTPQRNSSYSQMDCGEPVKGLETSKSNGLNLVATDTVHV